MDRADVAALANALREAFLAGGEDMRERKTVTGQAFLLSGRAVGQIDVRANVVRARLWLPERDRQRFEARPTFDPESGWIHVVSREDVEFVRKLVPVACRAAAAGTDAAPPAPRGIEVAPPRREPARAASASEARAGTASDATAQPAVGGARKGGSPETSRRAASAALPSRPRRTRG